MTDDAAREPDEAFGAGHPEPTGSVEDMDADSASVSAPVSAADSVADPAALEAEVPGPADAVEQAAAQDAAAPTKAPVSARKRRIRSAVEWLVVVAVALVVAIGIRQYLLQPFWIPSGSMEDTLSVGDRVLVNKAAYRFHDIRRGDVVVFEQPKAWPLAPEVKDLIKRVIAIEGDEVTIRDCSVWLNGGKLIEPYTDGKCTEPATDVLDPDGNGSFTVPADMLFVMGDNRTGSTDSRFNGFVPEDDVVGRAFVVIWPRSNWRWL